MTRTVHLLVALTLAATACSDEPAAPESAGATAIVSAAPLAATVRSELAALRAATARFHRFDVAVQDYAFLFANACMEGGEGDNVGGMGYHYVDLGLLDGTVEVASPEALLYEPGPNGQMRLVAVEYVIPKDAWTSSAAPVILGQEMKLNSFDLYALHVWVWKHNPDGLFKPWNPDVSCAYATAAMSH